MYWAEVNDLTGWLCRGDLEGFSFYCIIKRKGAGLDKWLGYFPEDTQIEAIDFVKLNKDIDHSLYIYDREDLIPIRYIGFNDKLSWKIQSDEFYNFEKILKDKNISYYMEGDTFIIDYKGNVHLNSLTSLPDKVVFNNQGNVYLYYLTSLPDNIVFNNKGIVDLPSIISLTSNKYEIFKNNGIVRYNSYKNIFDSEIKEKLSSKRNQLLEKIAAPESYTSGSDIDQPLYKDLSEWHIEDKNLPFLKDEFIGEDESPLKFVLDPNSEGYQKFDDFPDQVYDGVKANLKQLSWAPIPTEKMLNSNFGDIWKVYDLDENIDYYFVVRSDIKQGKNLQGIYCVQFTGWGAYTLKDVVKSYAINNYMAFSIPFEKQIPTYVGNINDKQFQKLSWQVINNPSGWLVKIIPNNRNQFDMIKEKVMLVLSYQEEQLLNEVSTQLVGWVHDGYDRYGKELSLEEMEIKVIQKMKEGNSLDKIDGRVYDFYPLRKVIDLDKIANELPKAEEIVQYDINPLTEMNLYPSKRKDNYDYKKRNTKGDEEILFEKGLHQSIDRPETSRELTPYGNKLSWKIQSDEFYNFEKELKDKNISYYLEGDTFIIDHKGTVNLYDLTSLPSNVVFNNQGNVYLYSLTSLPSDIVFNNQGNVYLNYLESLPDNIQFNNQGDVYLNYLTSLPSNKYEIFKNNGIVRYNYNKNTFDPRIQEKLSWQVIEDLAGWLVKAVSDSGDIRYGIVTKENSQDFNKNNGNELIFLKDQTGIDEEAIHSFKRHHGVYFLSFNTWKFYPIKYIGLDNFLNSVQSSQKLSWQSFTKRLLDSKEGDIWELDPHHPLDRNNFMIIISVIPEEIHYPNLGEVVIVTCYKGDTLEEVKTNFARGLFKDQIYVYESESNDYTYIGNIYDEQNF